MGDLVVETKRDGDFGILRLKGEARLEEVDALRKATRSLLQDGSKHILIGVRELTFADSASIGVLMEIQKDALTRGGGFVLHGCSPRFSKMLDAMGLGSRFKTASTEAAAKKAV
jgi:stage II sporulation protein AA (anti-sigma F factor antagonist)